MSQPTSPRRANSTRMKLEPTPTPTRPVSSPRAVSGAGGTEAEKRTALDAATRGDLNLISAYVPGHFREHDEVARQALHKAANYGNLSVVAYLIDDAHVDKDAVDKPTRKTAIHHACEKGKLDVVDYLVNHAQVDMTLVDRDGHSALDCAVLAGQMDVVRLMLGRLTQDAAKQGADTSRLAIEAKERECEAARAEAASERAVKETALAMAEGEALERREVLAELRAERERWQRAEAEIEELRNEARVLASIIADHEEEAEQRRQAAAEAEQAPPPAPAPVVVNPPLPPPKIEMVGHVPSGSMGEEVGHVGRGGPAVELLKGQLDKERKWRAEAEVDREALQRKLREVEEQKGRLEQDRDRLQAALELLRASLAREQSLNQAMVSAQEAHQAAAEAAANEVVTGFVLKQRQHSLSRDSWEPRFLVCQQGRLRYFNSDKEYLLGTPRSPRSGSSSASKVVDLNRSIAAVLPSDDLVFIVRPNDTLPEAESSPSSATSQLVLWFKCPDRSARDAWLKALQAQGCSISGHAVIGSPPSESTRALRHASTSGMGGDA